MIDKNRTQWHNFHIKLHPNPSNGPGVDKHGRTEGQEHPHMHSFHARREMSTLINYLTPWRKNPKVHHRTHNSPPPVPIPSQSNPIHTPQANLPKIHSDPIFPPTPWSSQWPLSFRLSHQNLVHFSLLSHACHMPRPPHSAWLDLPNDIWGRVQIMKFLKRAHTKVNL
jgi:hypothetical protein